MSTGIAGVSIHAPAWGATFEQDHHVPHESGFNPRSRVGSDLLGVVSEEDDDGFQSTLPRGERLRDYIDRGRYPKFQSTLPRGERPGVPEARPLP